MNCGTTTNHLPTRPSGASHVTADSEVRNAVIHQTREYARRALPTIQQYLANHQNRLMLAVVDGSIARNLSDSFSHDIDVFGITIPYPFTPLLPYDTPARKQQAIPVAEDVYVDFSLHTISDFFGSVLSGKVPFIEKVYTARQFSFFDNNFILSVFQEIRKAPLDYFPIQQALFSTEKILEANVKRLSSGTNDAEKAKARKNIATALFYKDWLIRLPDDKDVYYHLDRSLYRDVRRGILGENELKELLQSARQEITKEREAMSEMFSTNPKKINQMDFEVARFMLEQQLDIINRKG